MLVSNTAGRVGLPAFVLLLALVVGWAVACERAVDEGKGGGTSGTGAGTSGTGGTGTSTTDLCSNVGGCAATLCSMDCTKTCCCRGCSHGETWCVGTDLWRCRGNDDCWDVSPCTEGCSYAGSDFGSNCLENMSCEEIAAAYDYAVSRTDCYVPSVCVILSGHCSDGLGACYHAVDGDRTSQYDLDRLADAWNAAGCTGTVCGDCAPAPTTVDCVAGHCTTL